MILDRLGQEIRSGDLVMWSGIESGVIELCVIVGEIRRCSASGNYISTSIRVLESGIGSDVICICTCTFNRIELNPMYEKLRSASQ